jgi:hypothetical protein
MSEVSNVEAAVKTEAAKVAEEAKTFFAVEKAQLQAFLNYLASKPYAEVCHLVESLNGVPVVNLAPAQPAVPQAPAADPTPAPTVDASAPTQSDATAS